MQILRLHIILVILLQFHCFSSSAQNSAFYHAAIDEEFIPGKLNTLLLSREGFFYTGTQKGLYLFDGNSLQPFATQDSSLRSITALYEAKNGELWVGCSDGTVFRCSRQKAISWQPNEGLAKVPVSKMLQDKLGRLWIATRGEGLYVYHQNKLYNINTDDGLSDNYIYDLVIVDGKIIAATDNGISICWFDGTRKFIHNFNKNAGLADNIVQTISPDPVNKNVLWLGFQNGAVARFSLTNTHAETVYTNTAQEGQVNMILPLDQEIWLATNRGLTILSRNTYEVLQEEAIGKMQGVYADQEANVWLMQSNQLLKTKGEQVRLVLPLTPEENKDVHDVLIDKSGDYWITAKNGVVRYTRTGSNWKKTFYKLPLQQNTDITCMYEDASDHIWIGTMGDGLFVLDAITGSQRHITEIPGFEKASVLSVSGSGMHIWISGLEGVVKGTYNVQNTASPYSFETVTANSLIGSAYIYHILEDTKGRTWFATDGKGVVLYENNNFRIMGEKEGLDAKVIYSVIEDRKGNIWCSALNKGLYKWDGTKFLNFGINAGLTEQNISSLSKDNAGNLFCITPKSVFLINPVQQTILPVSDSRELGELNSDINSTYSNASVILFHTGKGVYSFHYPSYRKVLQPQTKISGVSLFLDKINPDSLQSFGYNENNFTFSFAGFYLTDPERVSYQYKLEGYNNNWQTTKDKFVNFPKLPPGNYTFRVRSSVTGNFENATEAVYKFTIFKPFWKKVWFIVLTITIITMILLYIIREREKAASRWQQLQTEKLQSQYETLKTQVNPHFLFNSFNTLLSIIDDDPEKASTYVEHLSDFYRSIVHMRDKDLISLREELRIIQDYFFIQKTRFCEALQFDNRLTDADKDMFAMPPLALQLLAENAIKHNTVSKDTPLTIELFTEEYYLVVKNNLNPKITPEKSEGLGLQNIKNRYQLLTGKDIVIEKTTDSFIVKLPLILSS